MAMGMAPVMGMGMGMVTEMVMDTGMAPVMGMDMVMDTERAGIVGIIVTTIIAGGYRFGGIITAS